MGKGAVGDWVGGTDGDGGNGETGSGASVCGGRRGEGQDASERRQDSEWGHCEGCWIDVKVEERFG